MDCTDTIWLVHQYLSKYSKISKSDLKHFLAVTTETHTQGIFSANQLIIHISGITTLPGYLSYLKLMHILERNYIPILHSVIAYSELEATI